MQKQCIVLADMTLGAFTGLNQHKIKDKIFPNVQLRNL